MTSKNDITGDSIRTKGVTTDAYRDSWERIFGKKESLNRGMDNFGNVIESDTPSTDDHGVHPEKN